MTTPTNHQPIADNSPTPTATSNIPLSVRQREPSSSRGVSTNNKTPGPKIILKPTQAARKKTNATHSESRSIIADSTEPKCDESSENKNNSGKTKRRSSLDGLNVTKKRRGSQLPQSSSLPSTSELTPGSKAEDPFDLRKITQLSNKRTSHPSPSVPSKSLSSRQSDLNTFHRLDPPTTKKGPRAGDFPHNNIAPSSPSTSTSQYEARTDPGVAHLSSSSSVSKKTQAKLTLRLTVPKPLPREPLKSTVAQTVNNNPTTGISTVSNKSKGKSKPKPDSSKELSSNTEVEAPPIPVSAVIVEPHISPDEYEAKSHRENPQKNKKFFRVGPPFKRTCQNFPILDSRGNNIYSIISSRIDRGFHIANERWITYKHNYMTITAAFSLTTGDPIEYGTIPNCNLYVNSDNTRLMICYFSLRVTAFQRHRDGTLIEREIKQQSAKRTTTRASSVIPVVPGLLPSHDYIKNNTTFRSALRKREIDSYFSYPRSSLGPFVRYYPDQEGIHHIVLFERVQFSGGEGNDCKVAVQLVATLENNESYVVSWTETPYFTLRTRSPASYGDNLFLISKKTPSDAPLSPHTKSKQIMFLPPKLFWPQQQLTKFMYRLFDPVFYGRRM